MMKHLCLRAIFVTGFGIIYRKFLASPQSSHFFQPDTAAGGVLLKKRFLNISQNLRENTCVWVSDLIKLQTSLHMIILLQIQMWRSKWKLDFERGLIFLWSMLFNFLSVFVFLLFFILSCKLEAIFH